MKNKILLNVTGFNAKKMIISTILKLDYDFVEFQGTEDFKFKYDLMKEKIILMIYELNEANYNSSFAMIKELSKNHIKTLLIIEHYDVKTIDDALASGANDIIELPLKEDVLKSKIKNILSNITKPLEYVEIKEITYMDPSVIDYEIIRADRGKYSISFVMTEFHGASEDELVELSEKFKTKLRETDLVMRYGSKKLLLVCPFTGKENIVEVENKVRSVIQENIDQLKNKVNVIVYGISYPKDGDNSAGIINLLNEGIRNSRLLSRIRGTFQDIRKDDIEAYKKIFRKK